MRFWFLLAGLWITSGTLVWGGSSPPPLAFRIHVQIAPEGLPQTQIVPVMLDSPPERIYVKRYAEISEKDLASVAARTIGGQPGLICQFTQHGQTVMIALTSQYQGQIMVVFLNGRVLFAPIIDTNVNNGQLFIPRTIPEAELAEIQRFIAKNNR
jgi:preprotein translocase subunit SecD